MAKKILSKNHKKHNKTNNKISISGSMRVVCKVVFNPLYPLIKRIIITFRTLLKPFRTLLKPYGIMVSLDET